VSRRERAFLRTGDLTKTVRLSERQISDLAAKKVFFGHQSVGNNILQGIRDLVQSDPRFKISIVRSAEPHTVPGPALVEFELGRNGDTKSKDDAFAAVVEKGKGLPGTVAMYKYCYVDIDASTDVQRLFEGYRQTISTLKAKYSWLTIIHITVPLTVVESAPKAWIKNRLGRVTAQDLNVKRNHFNGLLRHAYADAEPIFDLAEVESTRRDGSRCFFMRGTEKIYALAREFTSDGGHLNEAGRRATAERLLQILSNTAVRKHPTAHSEQEENQLQP